MKTKILPIIIFLLFNSSLMVAQSILSLTNWGGVVSGAGVRVESIASDQYGNNYLTGQFHDSVQIGPFVFMATSSCCDDVFLFKTDPNGNVLWAKRSVNNSNTQSFGLALDDSANIYIAGRSGNNLVIDSLIIQTSFSTGQNMFMAKFDSSGLFKWGEYFHTGSGTFNDLDFTADGHLYGGGFFSDSIGFPVALQSSNLTEEAFVARFDRNGSFQWSVAGTGPGVNDMINGISSDANSNLYATGNFSGSVQFNSTLMSNPTSAPSGYVVKFNSMGSVIYATKFTSGTNGDADAHDLIADTYNNVYVTGICSNNGIFAGSLSLPQAHVFIIKLNPSGTPVWIRGNFTDSPFNMGYNSNIAFKNNYVGVFAGMSGKTWFNGNDTLYNTGYYDTFYSTYDSSGTLHEIVQISGNGYDYSKSICFNNSGEAVLAGLFLKDSANTYLTAGLNLSNPVTVLAHEGYNSFLTKLSTIVSTESFAPAHSGFMIYPNPVHDLLNIHSQDAIGELIMNMYDVTGRKIMIKKFNRSATFSVSHLNAGIYFYDISDSENKIVHGKILKL